MESKTRVVKRYQNRKLYDTQDSCYVTLDEIGNLVKEGHDVKIIDNKTGDDLTSVTLTQIIFEEEKKKKSLLPLDMLRKIIQNPGQQVVEFVQKSIHQGVHSFSNVKGEAEKVLDKIKEELGDSGSFFKDLFYRTNNVVDELQKKIEEKFRSSQSQSSVGNVKDEIRSLRKKLAHLERKLKDSK
ncbi:MAG: transcriptional regulator [Deltaproteobacteria bacterium]|nr:transcriptional regulator [Deltaproteobacteria bacterium]